MAKTKTQTQRYEELVTAVSGGELKMVKFLWALVQELEEHADLPGKKIDEFQETIDKFIKDYKVKDGKDGKPGRDGRTGPRGVQGPQGPAGRGKDGRPGRDGRDGRPGRDGEDGKPGDMPEHEWDGTKIRFELPDGDWGPWVDIRGPQGSAGQSFGPGEGGGMAVPTLTVRQGGKRFEGVAELILADNLSATKIPNGLSIAAAATGGSGSGTATTIEYETPSGTVNDSNVMFTVTRIPLYIVVNGVQYFEGQGYSRSGLTLTLDNAVGTDGFIRSAFSSLGVETPSGTVNDANTSFTVSNEPLFVVVNGQKLFDGAGYSYSGGTITLDNPVGTGGFIRSVYEDGANNETPTGTVDDSNTSFTVENEPRYVVVNGLLLFAGAGYSYSGGTIDLDNAVGENGFIRSVY